MTSRFMRHLRKYLALAFLGIIALEAEAQIPCFGTPAGDGNVYGYASMAYRASANTWETYSTLQYGITDYMDIGADLYTDGHAAYIGYIFRAGACFSPYFNFCTQFTPSFDLSNGHRFAYMTEGILMNGNITRNGRLFWVANTWLEQADNTLSRAEQLTYLAYTFNLGHQGTDSLTALAGVIHDWKFEKDANLSIGTYYTHRSISVYFWMDDIITSTPRFTLAFEFKFHAR